MRAAILNDRTASAAEPGAYNDCDTLEVGNFYEDFGDAAGRSMFSAWAAMKAPLLIDTDVTNMTARQNIQIPRPALCSAHS